MTRLALAFSLAPLAGASASVGAEFHHWAVWISVLLALGSTVGCPRIWYLFSRA